MEWIAILAVAGVVLVLLGICAVLIYLVLKYRGSHAQIAASYAKFYNDYKDIIDRDAEITKREQEIARLQADQVTVEKDFNQKSRSLNEEYAQARSVYENLRREIALLEETLDLQSYGIYKPHYDFSTSEEYKTRLEIVREKQKNLIKAERAAICSVQWTVNGNRREGERQTKQYTKLMLRAFNGECDAAVLKVRWNNVKVMEERIGKAFEAINKLGSAYSASITDEYQNLKIDELRLAYEYQEKLNQEREEQRRIQEQIREEERAQREMERAKEEAEKEEERYEKALEKARADVEKAKGGEVDKLTERIRMLEEQVQQAHELKERAIAQAQITKAGHVYIISNIGSFGENVYKIGMTRRLEPMDRIRELGDASVPFDFDVHAMIYSENAPELEGNLQEHFKCKQINLVNDRKEFFNVTIDEIEDYARRNGLKVTITKIAEAKEYRESLALKAQAVTQPVSPLVSQFPETLISAN